MKLIRGGNFYEFVKCPRKVYLNFHGDPEKKLPFSEFMQEKMEEGREFEDKIASKLKFKHPNNNLPYEEQFKQTMKFMKDGESLIYQGMLMDENFLGIPDFLEKVEGKSNLGDYYYQICDVKTGLSPKLEYIMQIIFYSYVLGKMQGFMPPKTYLILGDESRIEINVQEKINKFSEIFQRIKEIAAGAKEDIYIASVCKECVWRNVCFEEAEKEKHISLIYNLPREKIATLKNLGIKNLKDTSKMDIEELSKVKGLTKESLNRWKLQAESLLKHKSIKLQDHKFPKEKPIYFDIEDIEIEGKKIIYLFGLIADKKYISFLAKNPKDAKKIWLKFLDYFKDKEDFKLYTYSEHERASLKKLYQEFGGDEFLYKKITENLIDLLKIVKQAQIFPIYSYSIKDVAKFLGFQWTAEDAGGAQSMVWYEKWLETKNKKYLNEVLRYNEEDCRAMQIIKEFIEKK
jgi:uncharacterized protein